MKPADTVTVQLTAAHIAHGVAGDCNRCPIALCLDEATGYSWEVGHWYCHATDGTRKVGSFATTPQMCNFIRRVDNYGAGEVEPFAFELPRALAGKAAAA